MKLSDFEPVSKAEAAASAQPAKAAPAAQARSRRRKAPPVAVAPAAAVVAPPPLPPPPVFVGGKPRSAAFDLDYPLLYDGRTYGSITLRRPTEGEVGDFMDALAEGGSAPFPIFYTLDDAPVPPAVIEALDPDDRDRIMGRLTDFLPDRLRRLAEALSDQPSIPPDGATTAPTSST